MSNENCSCGNCKQRREAKARAAGYANGISSNSTGTGGTSSATGRVCTHCGKQVPGGVYILNVFYCPMCASIINKNNQSAPIEKDFPDKIFEEVQKMKSIFNMLPDSCKGCPNHPSNGGSGVCHCTIPYMNGHGPTCSVSGLMSELFGGDIPVIKIVLEEVDDE